LAAASTQTARSVICEPMCSRSPRTSTPGSAGRAAIEPGGVGVRDAELALLQAGRDVRDASSDRRPVDAKRDRARSADAAGDRIERLELGRRFDVEAANAAARAASISVAALPTPEKTIFADRRRPRARARALRRNDVEAAAEPRKNVQYSEIGIRLDRVADEMRGPLERAVECAKRLSSAAREYT
jgi:hypothetical protein